ncbi:MAG: hypothetical protein V9G20_24740 [Candidatus Promineifilaceae bacterium]
MTSITLAGYRTRPRPITGTPGVFPSRRKSQGDGRINSLPD